MTRARAQKFSALSSSCFSFSMRTSATSYKAGDAVRSRLAPRKRHGAARNLHAHRNAGLQELAHTRKHHAARMPEATHEAQRDKGAVQVNQRARACAVA